jgi:ribosomal protein L12E/L44/L45/RPP1/RPP2
MSQKYERKVPFFYFLLSSLFLYKMSQDQQQKQIQHSLSRLALAKAIKTPEEGDSEAEPWSKSVIFNQPFIKQLQKQKQQFYHKNNHHSQDKSNSELKSQLKSNQNRSRNRSTSSNIGKIKRVLNVGWKIDNGRYLLVNIIIEKKLSELSIKKSSSTTHTTETTMTQHSCLPSDSEGEHNSEEEEEDEEGEEEDEENSDGSEIFQGKKIY